MGVCVGVCARVFVCVCKCLRVCVCVCVFKKNVNVLLCSCLLRACMFHALFDVNSKSLFVLFRCEC